MLLGASRKSPQLSRLPKLSVTGRSLIAKPGDGIAQFAAVMEDPVSGRLVERRFQTQVGHEQIRPSIPLPGRNKAYAGRCFAHRDDLRAVLDPAVRAIIGVLCGLDQSPYDAGRNNP